MAKSDTSAIYLRNVIFGVEDSLVSTVGLLAGIATADIATGKILMVGVIYLFVEGFSMAAGSYLSEHSTQEYETGRRVVGSAPLIGGLVMFLSFLIAGFIPIIPYLIFPLDTGIIASVIVSLIFLAILGYVQANVSKVSMIPSILRMVVVGGIAVALGVVVGKAFGVA